MRVGDFSLEVQRKNDTPEGYVEMTHGEVYALRVTSFSDRRADVRIEIDGEEIGAWRVEPRSGFVLERGVSDSGKFTFFLSGSKEASQAGLTVVPEDQLGLIKATFLPELVRPMHKIHRPTRLTRGTMFSFQSSGGTGLTGHSDQQFSNVAGLQHDNKLTTVVHLRLIGKSEVRPKVSYQNPVPPPIR